ncbi:hypothetical protein [Dongia rigui]|uniref:Uncharacterized protein n=1 Tax=Dongia rigui TaxID=940149 RepID=A0ABU5DV96_9PROT|nr:hypothetical protein [Dongia rigui]MDY0870860.1 hypothetical protein [Dongia rigui]
MPRPIPRVIRSFIAKKTEELQPLKSPKSSPDYAEKLNLATDLHAQGIDPIRWTAAQPADWATQQAFQKTGQKDDRHFAVGGRLYRTTPQVAANQAQGQDAIDVYLGADAKPVEQLVDIARVPLTHPAGRPHDTAENRPDFHALNLHYARVGVDPALAHNGDPLPMETQLKLQQATRAPDGSEIPLGIPGIYRGYDDGYFYAANEGTKESPEVQALRRKLATEKAQAQGDASAMAANDNDLDIDEAVARNHSDARTRRDQEKKKRLQSEKIDKVEVLFFEPAGWAESSFGHVAMNVDGVVYSWGPEGMFAERFGDYMKRNNFRDATGFALKLDKHQKAALKNHIASYGDAHNYNWAISNCADPIESGLEELGFPLGLALTPKDLRDALVYNKIVDGNVYTLYKADPDQAAPPFSSAPWSVLGDN